MAVSADHRVRPIAGAETEFDQDERTIPSVRSGIDEAGQGTTVFYIFAALVILVGGYYVYDNYVSPGAMTPNVTQTTTPPPVTTAPFADAPSQTPPVAPSITAPADTPVAPAVDPKIP
jgi:hypothetical protein